MNPYLPKTSNDLNASHTRNFRIECGERYYLNCLELSQSYWLQNKQAQAILQINKAFMADLNSIVFQLPYMALAWFLNNRKSNYFLGNPVRHFQHLASRMSGPRKELRSWRAWACFYIAQNILPKGRYPRDEEQIRIEFLIIPKCSDVISMLNKIGLKDEGSQFKLSLIRR